MDEYPAVDSPLVFDRFFPKLYEIYDMRFVYAAPALESKTRRVEWALDSPVAELANAAGFQLRADGAD